MGLQGAGKIGVLPSGFSFFDFQPPNPPKGGLVYVLLEIFSYSGTNPPLGGKGGKNKGETEGCG